MSLSKLLIFVLFLFASCNSNVVIKNEQNMIDNNWNISNNLTSTIWWISNNMLEDIINEVDTEQIDDTIIDNSITYYVNRIIDWDTVDIIYDWENTRLRLIWIDTPENTTLRNGSIECYWKESKDYLYNILNWKKISIELDKTQWKFDKYGRLLVYIFLNEENINNKIIKEWYGFEYTYNKAYKYIDLFKVSELDAKSKWIWLWSEDTCNWNRTVNNDNIIVENKNIECNIKWNISYTSKEKIYHRPWCQSYKQTKISVSKWERWFCTEQEAIDAGWRIAGNCN
jgi:micrococcal nuclease